MKTVAAVLGLVAIVFLTVAHLVASTPEAFAISPNLKDLARSTGTRTAGCPPRDDNGYVKPCGIDEPGVSAQFVPGKCQATESAESTKQARAATKQTQDSIERLASDMISELPPAPTSPTGTDLAFTILQDEINILENEVKNVEKDNASQEEKEVVQEIQEKQSRKTAQMVPLSQITE